MEAGKDVERLQKKVKAFKLLKYRNGYNDGRQGKAPRYPLDYRNTLFEQNHEVAQQNLEPPPRNCETNPIFGVN